MATVVAFASALLVALGAFGACNGLPRADDDDDALSQSLELMLQNLMESLEGTADDERLSWNNPPPPPPPAFSWRDCGGSQTVVHFKGLQMNANPCLKTPGKAMLSYNTTVDSDVSAPISLNLDVRMRNGSRLIDICPRVPGGCKRDDVCPKGQDSAEENEEGTEEAWGLGEENDDYGINPSQSANMCIRKGNFSLPMTFDVPSLPAGSYRVRASLYKKDTRTRVACLYLRLDTCP